MNPKHKNTTSSQIHLINVPNTVKGRKQISDLRTAMKAANSSVRLTLYGRGHRFGKGRIRGSWKNGNFVGTNFDNRYQSNVPMSVAQNIAVYVTTRRTSVK